MLANGLQRGCRLHKELVLLNHGFTALHHYDAAKLEQVASTATYVLFSLRTCCLLQFFLDVALANADYLT
jgi:hypothetical protein